MFTGIVEEVGIILHIPPRGTAGQMGISAHTVLEGTRVGDSICTNGVCLTVTSLKPDGFTVDVMPQTLSHSNLGLLRVGDSVNLERAMPADGRFGGHMVSGHIDGTGTVYARKLDKNAVRLQIRTTPQITCLIIPQGSVAIDGASLTVTDVEATCFGVSLIPHTAANTILFDKHIGDSVNLECDIVGKYVQKLLEEGPSTQNETEPSGITMDFLAKHGF